MSADSNVPGEIFTTLETDTIGEIMNISMGSAATAASTLLDNKVTITTPVVQVMPIENFDITQLEPAVAVEIQYVEGISGSNILILKKSDVKAILEQMMMTEFPDDFEVDEMAESAICELMNQMMGSSATVLSCFLGRTINISTPRTVPIGELEEFRERYFEGEENLVSIEFTLTIKDSIESKFVSAMRIHLAKEIIDISLNFDAENSGGDNGAEADASAAPVPPAPSAPEAAPPAAAAPPPPAAMPEQAMAAPPPPAAMQQPMAAPPTAYPQQPMGAPPPGYYPPPAYAPQPAPMGMGYDQSPIAVRDYSYGDFAAGGAGGSAEHPLNLDLVMNVPVVMTVELGRTRRKIKEILEFGQGTIVELDKQAGSQVDVIVNGQMIAKGDVVVVDDNFSIRITEIIKNRDPLSML